MEDGFGVFVEVVWPYRSSRTRWWSLVVAAAPKRRGQGLNSDVQFSVHVFDFPCFTDLLLLYCYCSALYMYVYIFSLVQFFHAVFFVIHMYGNQVL